jgi:16S rRNA (guanine966-N2)-methyltransferase
MGKRVARDGRPGSVRIIGGQWRGRRLAVADASAVRPTPDRVRETLFNGLAGTIEGSRCLDLFAGTGVLGLEALSRGAREAVLVERDRLLAQAIERHAAAFGAPARVVAADALDFLRGPTGEPYDVVFLDPPYAEPLAPLLERLPPWAGEHTLIYVERPAETSLATQVAGARLIKQARAGAVAFGLVALPQMP